MKRLATLSKICLFIQLLFPFQGMGQNNQCEHYHQLAITEYENGDPQRAYQYICKSLALYDSLCINNLALYAEIKHDVAMMSLYDNDNIDIFISCINEAIRIKHQLYGNAPDYYWSIECFAEGLLHLSLEQDFPNNIVLLESAKEQYERLNNYKTLNNYSLCLNNLAEAYEDVDIKSSIRIALLSLSVKRENKDPDSLITMSNLGNYYKEDERFDSAMYYLKQVLDERTKTQLPNDEKLIISNMRLASLFGRIKEFDSAYYYSEKAREIERWNFGDSTERYATIMMNSGLYKIADGDIINGINFLRVAYQNPKSDKLTISTNLANIFGWPEVADSCYKYTIIAWDEISKKIATDLSGLSMQNRFLYLSQERTYHLLSLPVFCFLKHEEHEGLKRLAYISILFYRELIMKYLWDVPDRPDMESQINSISHSLKNNEVAIDMWSDKSDLYSDVILAFILKPNEDTPTIVKLSKDSIIMSLNGDIPTTSTYLPLFENIWKDIINNIGLERGGRVFFVVDDILSQIPIESICDYKWEYIGDIYDIVRVSSTANIPRIKSDILSETSENNTMALYGGLTYDCTLTNNAEDTLLSEIRGNAKYLPWTKKEVDRIKAMIDSNSSKKQVTLFTDANGTEESVKKLSTNPPTILHFATHGIYLQPTIPMDWYSYYTFCMNNAGILLSCSSEDNGFLSADEIRDIDLSNTDLVVLSACNTGNGGITPWGIVGLQQAFKSAGVNTIIMTIGKINDVATSIFMEEFYGGLLEGMTKRDAFKQAQLSIRRNEYFKDFNYWAYFIIID